MEIKYQDALMAQLNSMTYATMPRTTLLCGEKGCGKHTVSKYMAERFGLPLNDITDDLSLELINEIYMSTTPACYLIDMNKIVPKEQNVILKFLEEPSDNIYIMLLVNNVNMLLPTIINRCIRFDFAKYTQEQLQTFATPDRYACLQFCSTPGDVLDYQMQDISLVTQFAEKVILKLGTTTIPNAIFGIPKRLAFSNEQNKINVELFIKTLKRLLHDRIVQNQPYYDAYMLTNRLLIDCQKPKMNIQQLFEVYLIDLREVLKREAIA